MGLFKKQWQGSRHLLLLLIINLVCWFFDIAVAQADVFAKAFESLNFPLEAITCVVNILVFITTLLRGRLDLENGAREALGILTVPKLENKNTRNGNVLTTCTGEESIERASVLMLHSSGRPNWSIKQFMESNAQIHNVQSILLEFTSEGWSEQCNCIVFLKVAEITRQTPWMPLTLEKPNNQCLLPCRTCLAGACHGLSALMRRQDQDDEAQRWRESVVYDILDDIHARSISTREPICICIPLNDAGHDNWTKLLVRSFRSKNEESRGVTVVASEALEKYVDGNGGRVLREEVYHGGIVPFIGPRLAEIFINLVLTFWFAVDGFSSSFVARRTIRNYLMDSKGNGLAANSFLIKATVKFNALQVCQVLTFRGNCFSVITLSFIAAGANLICVISWGLLIAFERGDSVPRLSIARVAVIIAAIGIAFFIDIFYVCLKKMLFGETPDYRVLVIILEMVCVVGGAVLVKIVGIHIFGKWIYGALQGLVWVKWGIGSYILEKNRREEFGCHYRVLVFSSAFLLNAAFAGARSKWSPSWPWKDNYLFSKAGKH